MGLRARIVRLGDQDPAVAWSVLFSGVGLGMLIGVLYVSMF